MPTRCQKKSHATNRDNQGKVAAHWVYCIYIFELKIVALSIKVVLHSIQALDYMSAKSGSSGKLICPRTWRKFQQFSLKDEMANFPSKIEQILTFFVFIKKITDFTTKQISKNVHVLVREDIWNLLEQILNSILETDEKEISRCGSRKQSESYTSSKNFRFFLISS